MRDGPTRAEAARDAPAMLLADRYQVEPSAPLPEFSSATADAYLARDIAAPEQNLLCLLVHAELPLRSHTIATLQRNNLPGVLRPMHVGALHWPLLNRECTAIVLTRPLGDRLAPASQDSLPPYPPDALIREVIAPVAATLQALDHLRLTHRAIRPDNMYRSDTAGIVLGDCFSAPHGATQPALYEPLERTAVAPEARGSATIAADLYALGATTAVLLLGGGPRAAADDRTVVAAKAASGSFSAITGQERLPSDLAVVLRGLLCDDRHQRWDLATLQDWLDQPSQANAPATHLERADRAFTFGAGSYDTTQGLAVALASDWDSAIDVVVSGDLADWAKRFLPDKPRATALSQTAEGDVARRARTAAAERQLARALIALDPDGPIRFRSFAAMPDGLGPALAAITDQGAAPVIEDFISAMDAGLPDYWLSQQRDKQRWMVEWVERCRKLAQYVTRAGPGFGVERCLYELNPNLRCRSPLLAGKMVCTLDALIPALEARPSMTEEPFDVHIAAFIAAHMRGGTERTLTAVASADRGESLLARMRLLAAAERATDMPAPRLCGLYLGRMTSIIERFHNRPLRTRMRQALEDTAAQGRLAPILAIVENPRYARWDANGFRAAQESFRAAGVQARALAEAAASREEHAQTLGRRVAAQFSAGIALLALAILTVTYVV